MIIYITTFYHMEAAPASVLINLWECLFYGSQVGGQYHDDCNGVTAVQLAVFLFSLGLISIAAGFVRPCSIALGADQLDNERQLVLRQCWSFNGSCNNDLQITNNNNHRHRMVKNSPKTQHISLMVHYIIVCEGAVDV